MTTDLLTTLLQRLDAPAARYAVLDRYFDGTQPLTYLSPDARKALGDRLTAVSVNVPRLLVESVAERLRVTGFTGVDLWTDWLASDLDQTSHVLHREALTLGSAYAIVWAANGRPNVSVESARQVVTLCDPGTRQTVAAVKRWETASTTEAVLYQPDSITRLRANSKGATTAGFNVVETIPNPLGVVPVVRFANRTRLLEEGRSEMADVLALTDAVVKLTTDMLVSSEYTARPRRFATGVELEEEEVIDPDTGQPTGETEAVNPIPEGSRAMVSENPEAKFGQLPGSDLSGYENAIGVVMRQISAVSGLPEHLLGIGGDNPQSADAIRVSEAALTARAEARQASFGRSWETVAKLMVAVRDGVDPESVHPRIAWADPSTRSVAQEADAVVKLYAAGLLPASTALARLGYSENEIADIRAARRAEALDVAGTDLKALLS